MHTRVRNSLSAFFKGQRGASLVEYALLIALIAVVSIGAMGFVGRATGNTFDSVSRKMQPASGGICDTNPNDPSCP